MKVVRYSIAIIVSVFFLIVCTFSCSDNKTKIKHNHNDLPGFYDIDFNDIFTKEDSEVDSNIQNTIAQYYKTFWEQNDLSGGFLVAKGNKIIFENYRGFANKEKQIPITVTTPIHLASVSKNFTAMAILKLVEAHKLSLQQKVSHFLPTFPYPNISVFDLLTHRSGLPDYGALAELDNWWNKDEKFLTNESVLRMFARCKPQIYNPPNSHFDYCNTNYAFLALIIEKITKKSYPIAMKEMIFEPLGMKHSYVFEKKHFQTASLSYFNNGKLHPWDFRDLVYGDKNIYATPQDMLRYSQAMFSDKFLRKSLLDSAFIGYSNEKKGNKNYGFGFRIYEFDNGKKISYHNGWWHGNNSVFIHLPEEKVTIIGLGNKKSRAVYSAFSLSALFGDYPFAFMEADTTEFAKRDSLQIQLIQLLKNKKVDSAYFQKKNKQKNDSIKKRKDSLQRKNKRIK